MSSSLPAVPPLRSPGGWLLLLPAHLAALLQAFLAACRQHPEQGVPPGWLPVPAGAPLAAVRQAVGRACGVSQDLPSQQREGRLNVHINAAGLWKARSEALT